MRQTVNYQIPYYELGDATNPDVDSRRVSTIENQIFGLASIFGNGVLSGWEVLADRGLSVNVFAGNGFVNYTFANTFDTTAVTGLVENTTNYIYARLTDDTTYTQIPQFFSSTQYLSENNQTILLASVTTGTNEITLVDTSVRRNIGFIAKIIEEIQKHKHTGDTDSPEKIDLASEVAGILPGFRIGDIDASQITEGRLGADRLPQIDHLNLLNKGILTHPQIDSFVQNLQNPNGILFGEIATADFLQYILSLKHAWNVIDEYFFNEFSFIPGISPDLHIDTEHTTAIVDKTNHEIKGILARTGRLEFVDFKNKATFDGSTKTNTYVYDNQTTGDVSIKLTRPAETQVIEDFENVSLDAQDIPGYAITTEVINDESYFRSNITTKEVGQFSGEIRLDQGQRVVIGRTFDVAQDWSSFSRLSMYVRSNSNTHGTLFMDVMSGDSPLATFTPLADKEITDGFVERNYDLTAFENRESVTGIRFRTDTSNGWDPTVPFNVFLDRIAIFNDLFYEPQGSIFFKFDSPIPVQWRNISWEAETPNSTSVAFRTRTANTEAELRVAPYSPEITVSGSAIDAQDSKYIEIEAILRSNVDRLDTPTLNSVKLGLAVDSVTDAIDVDSQADFLEGKLFENIDTTTIPDSIQISDPIRVTDIVYGRRNIVQQISQNRVAQAAATGNKLPLSPRQAAGYLTQVPGFEFANHVVRLENRNFLITDTLNDRVVEVDSNSDLVHGIVSNRVPDLGSPGFFPVMAYYNSTTGRILLGMSRRIVPSTMTITQIIINSQNDSFQLTSADTLVQGGDDALTSVEIELSSDHQDRIESMFNDNVAIRIPNGTFLEDIDSSVEAFKNVNTLLGFPMYQGNLYSSEDIFQPISLSVTSDSNWIIGNAKNLISPVDGINSMVEINPTTVALVRASNAVDFNTISLGAAKQMSNGNWMVAGHVSSGGELSDVDEDGQTTEADALLTTQRGRVVILREEDLAPMFEYNTDENLFPSDVSEDTDGYPVVAEKSLLTINAGRIIKIDYNGNVVRQFGQGSMTFPNDVRVLENGNYFISL